MPNPHPPKRGHPWKRNGPVTPHNRLSDETIQRIRELRAAGFSVHHIAKECGVGERTVRKYAG